MDPEKMEKELEAFFKSIEEEKSKMPSVSPRDHFVVNPVYAEAWRDCFLSNKTILHLDFSNNDFSAHEVEIMGKLLRLLYHYFTNY